MPDGAQVERHIERPGPAVCVLPYDKDQRRALFVSMPRAAVIDAGEAPLLEVIAGALGSEEAAECARREALEEAGVRLSELEPAGVVWTMPSHSSEKITLFLAPFTAADVIAQGGGAADENENITVVEMGLDTLWRALMRNELKDMKTMVLVQALFMRHPHLAG